MAFTCEGPESAPIRRAGDRRPVGLRPAAVPAVRGRTRRRAATGEDGGASRGAGTGEHGRTPSSAATGEACRHGLLALTLLLAAAAAGAQPLVSPADAAALRRLMPEAVHFELHDRSSRHFRAFAAPEAGAAPRLIGLAFFTTDLAPRIYAYKGRITSLVAMDPGGRLIGVQVVHHYEPFGYFSIDLPGFTPQFAGKSILEPLEVGGDIDAVSRATITMEAATRAIRQGARRLARDFLAEQSADR